MGTTKSRTDKVEAMNSLKTTELERSRIEKIIDAANRQSWAEFKSLTDMPFLNEENMKEQFELSSTQLQGEKSHIETNVRKHRDGTRMIFSKIILENDAKRPLMLTLHGTDEGNDSKIWILTFNPELDLGDL